MKITPLLLSTMENLGTVIVNAWADKIAAKMTAEKTAYVEFRDGTDFNLNELPWIRSKLIPALAGRGMTGSIRIYAKKGDGIGCDCYGSPCEHATGRIFAVSLKD